MYLLYFSCRHFHDFQKRIPRAEMIQLRDIALGHIAKEDKTFVASVCGSFRRGEIYSIISFRVLLELCYRVRGGFNN